MVLMTMTEEATIVEDGASKHFLHQLPKRVIEVRGKWSTVRSIKTKGTNIRFTHTNTRYLPSPRMRRWFDEWLYGA